jgi:hypothetical protein
VLVGLAVGGVEEGGAQRAVPLVEGVYGRLQGCFIETAVYLERQRDVEGGLVGIELVQHQQPLLGK